MASDTSWLSVFMLLDSVFVWAILGIKAGPSVCMQSVTDTYLQPFAAAVVWGRLPFYISFDIN